MDNFEAFIERRCFCDQKQIQQICEPLVQHYGIDLFYYFWMNSKGDYYTATSSERFYEGIAEAKGYQHNPIMTDPRLFYNSEHFFEIPIDSQMTRITSKLHQEYHFHPCLSLFCKPCHDELHGFGFSTTGDPSLMRDAIIATPEVFDRFADYFLEKAAPFLSRLRRYNISYLDIPGPDFYTPNDFHKQMWKKEERKQAFFSALAHPKSFHALTDREKECVKLYLEGNTASTTAKLLHISRRTVETHFEHVKGKLGLSSKRDLFDSRIQKDLQIIKTS